MKASSDTSALRRRFQWQKLSATRDEVRLYEVFNGVLYLLKDGYQWRMPPAGFPKWRNVHSYFAQWSEPVQDGSSVTFLAISPSRAINTQFH
jgi:transposase